jgi:hypothetical protein
MEGAAAAINGDFKAGRELMRQSLEANERARVLLAETESVFAKLVKDAEPDAQWPPVLKELSGRQLAVRNKLVVEPVKAVALPLAQPPRPKINKLLMEPVEAVPLPLLPQPGDEWREQERQRQLKGKKRP